MFSDQHIFQIILIQLLLLTDRSNIGKLALFLKTMNVLRSTILFAFNCDLYDFRITSEVLIFGNLNATRASCKLFPKGLFPHNSVA